MNQELKLYEQLTTSYLKLTGDRKATPDMIKKAHRKAYKQYLVLQNHETILN